jgi:acyl carrier protein
MDEITTRLRACFKTVFPDLPEARILGASPASVEAWDSIATVTLANVIEDEFGIQVDFDRLGELDSFSRFREYLLKETQAT